MPKLRPQIDDFTREYLTAAMFTDQPEEWCTPGEFQESERANIGRMTVDTIRKAAGDCKRFRELASAAGIDIDDFDHYEQMSAARDFWYTRNGHGAGFWDGDWEKSIGEKLTSISKMFQETGLDFYKGRIYMR